MTTKEIDKLFEKMSSSCANNIKGTTPKKSNSAKVIKKDTKKKE